MAMFENEAIGAAVGKSNRRQIAVPESGFDQRGETEVGGEVLVRVE